MTPCRPAMALAFFLCLSLLACDKTARSPAFTTTIDYFYDLYNHAGNRYWLMARDPANGAIRVLDRLYPGAQKMPYAFQSDVLSPDSLYEFSILVAQANGKVSLFAWQAAPNDSKLPFSGPAPIDTATRLLNFNLKITDRPELDDLQVVSANPAWIYIQDFNTPAAFVGNAVTSSLGFFIRAKPRNGPWHSLWYKLPPGDLHDLTLPWSDFQPEVLDGALRFPLESDWRYALEAVTPEGKPIPLAGQPQTSPVLLESGRFRLPPGISIEHCRLWAIDSKFGYGYDTDLPATTLLTLPPFDFKIDLNMSPNGYIAGIPDGHFDVLEAAMYGGVQSQVSIYVSGPAVGFRYYPPKLPDSLGLSWFNKVSYYRTNTNCIDYQGLEDYQAWLQTDKTRSGWPARLQTRFIRQEWTP